MVCAAVSSYSTFFSCTFSHSHTCVALTNILSPSRGCRSASLPSARLCGGVLQASGRLKWPQLLQQGHQPSRHSPCQTAINHFLLLVRTMKAWSARRSADEREGLAEQNTCILREPQGLLPMDEVAEPFRASGCATGGKALACTALTRRSQAARRPGHAMSKNAQHCRLGCLDMALSCLHPFPLQDRAKTEKRVCVRGECS